MQTVGIGKSAQQVLEQIDTLSDADVNALYEQMVAEDKGQR